MVPMTTTPLVNLSALIDGAKCFEPGPTASLAGRGPGQRESGSPALSADGRFVAFASHASNLVPGDTNGAADVFVRTLVGQP
jgi:hypothetical protein